MARLGGPRGDWLRYQVRQSQDPLDLWLLRGAVFEAIGSLTPAARQARLELQRAVDTVFPTGDDPANSLPPLFL